MTTVRPTDPDEIEQAVSAHLAKALDGQRGRAAAAFRTQMMSIDAPGGGDAYSFARAADARGMRTLKIWAGAASALAACLAVVVTLQVASRMGTGGGEHVTAFPGSVAGHGDANVMNVSAPMMDQVELSRDVDGGTAMLPDNTPVRVVRQQTLRQTQWFDPNEKATYRVTEPGEQVGYVRIQPY